MCYFNSTTIKRKRGVNIMTIKRIREKTGISQEELAKQLEVTQGAVSQWEAGKAKPRTDKLPILAKIFNCSVDDLLKE